MCIRWANWMYQAVLRTSAARVASRPASRYRPLIVEECEDRLTLSAWFPATSAEGGFIDIYRYRFNAYDGPSPGGDAGNVQPSWVTANIGLQRPEVALIVADELMGTDQEGGLIDLTLVDRETHLFASSLPLVEETVSEDIPLVADMPDVSVPPAPDVSSRFVRSILEPAASAQAPTVGDVPSDSFVPVSLSMPAEERIDGARGRAQAFDLAIRASAPTPPLKTSAAIEPLGSEAPTPARPAQVSESVSVPVSERSEEDPIDDPTEAVPDREPQVPSRAVVAESSPRELMEPPDVVEKELEALPSAVDQDESIRDGIFSVTERFLPEDRYRELSAGAADSAEDLADGVPTEYDRAELWWVTEARAEAARRVGDVVESSFARNSSDSQAPVADVAVADRLVADVAVADRTDAARREGQEAETNAVEKKTGLDRGHEKVSGSSQKASTGEAGNSVLPVTHRHMKPAQAQKTDADDDRAEHGKTADIQRPTQIAAVLATGVAGRYLGTRRRHRSVEEPQSAAGELPSSSHSVAGRRVFFRALLTSTSADF